MKVIHNVRDYWFEQELHRFGIDIGQHINSHTIPIAINRKYRLPGIFNWAESLQIQCDGKNYTIDRANRLTIETDMNGTLKVSTQKDLFLRSTFTAKTIHTQGKQQDDNHLQQSFFQPNSGIPPKKSTRKKITVKDTIPAKDTEPQKQFSTTKHQGFEENDAF